MTLCRGANQNSLLNILVPEAFLNDPKDILQDEVGKSKVKDIKSKLIEDPLPVEPAGQFSEEDEDDASDPDFEIPSFHTFCLLKEMSRRFPSGTRIGLSLSLTSGQPSCGW